MGAEIDSRKGPLLPGTTAFSPGRAPASLRTRPEMRSLEQGPRASALGARSPRRPRGGAGSPRTGTVRLSLLTALNQGGMLAGGVRPPTNGDAEVWRWSGHLTARKKRGSAAVAHILDPRVFSNALSPPASRVPQALRKNSLPLEATPSRTPSRSPSPPGPPGSGGGGGGGGGGGEVAPHAVSGTSGTSGASGASDGRRRRTPGSRGKRVPQHDTILEAAVPRAPHAVASSTAMRILRQEDGGGGGGGRRGRGRGGQASAEASDTYPRKDWGGWDGGESAVSRLQRESLSRASMETARESETPPGVTGVTGVAGFSGGVYASPERMGTAEQRHSIEASIELLSVTTGMPRALSGLGFGYSAGEVGEVGEEVGEMSAWSMEPNSEGGSVRMTDNAQSGGNSASLHSPGGGGSFSGGGSFNASRPVTGAGQVVPHVPPKIVFARGRTLK
ncbi:hypothetical protein T484DRAFT_1881778, partial [Baffinella frigidus]